MAGNGRHNADDAIAAALAAGKIVRDAAAEVGVAERTIHRRLSEAGFRARVDELRSELVATALGRMADTMADAADTLRRLLGAESEAVRLGAARSILELGCRLRESVELEQRLTTLEAAANARKEMS